METEIGELGAAEKLSFIRDEAKPGDFFGTHKRVASAVASVVRTHPELKVIGLVGAWGSGKSTVVSLVQNFLEADETKETRFFVYDAWLHQSDPPRRSFLEALVAFLRLDKNTAWEKKLAALNGQVDEKTTTTTPTLTPSGRAVLISLLLLPLGYGLFSTDWLGKTIWLPYLEDVAVFWLGAFLLSLPLFISLFLYVKWRPTKNPFQCDFWCSKNWTTHKPPHDKDSILTLFMNRAVTTFDHFTSKEPDPTAIEFQRTFRDLMREVYAETHRYVFVIDNLDRLPEAAALDLWTTIRSFFLGALEERERSDLLPTILLPIDPEAVERMYRAEHGDVEAKLLAKAFLDKTLDVTFYVPHPVFSGWRDYLSNQMKEVFGTVCQDAWVYETSYLYERYLLRRGIGEVTPRLINTLLNSIAISWLQRREEVDEGTLRFSSLAYFNICREEIEGSLVEFISQKRPEIAKFDEAWPDAIAALYYGVPVSAAMQVTLVDPLRSSIQKGDEQSFLRLANVPGFDRVFDLVMEHASTEPEFVANAALLFARVEGQTAPFRSSAWRQIAEKYAQCAAWQNLTQEHLIGIEAILANVDLISLRRISRAIVQSVVTIDKGTNTPEHLVPLMPKFVSVVYQGLSSRGLKVDEIVVPGGARTFFEVLYSHRENSSLVRTLTTSASAEDLLSDLQSQMTDQKLAQTVVAKLEALLISYSSLVYNPFVATAVELVKNNGIKTIGVGEALQCLAVLRKAGIKVATSAVTVLASEGFLFEKFHQAHQAKRLDDEATVLAMLIVEDPKFEKGRDGRGQNGFALVNVLESSLQDRASVTSIIDTRLKSFSRDDDIVTYCSTANENAALKPLFRRIWTARLKRKEVQALDVGKVIGLLPECLELIEDSAHQDFVAYLSRQAAFWGQVRSAGVGDNTIQLLQFLLNSSDPDVSQEASGETYKLLRALDVAQWTEALETANKLFQFAFSFLSTAVPLDEGSPLYRALDQKLVEVLRGDDASVVERWFNLAGLLADDGFALLMRAVRDRIVSGETGDGVLFALQVGDGRLLEKGRFLERGDEAIQYVVVRLLGNKAGTDWITKHSTEIAGWLRGASENTKRLLSGQLKSAWEAGDAAAKEQLSTCGAQLGLADMPRNVLSDVDSPNAISEDGNETSDKQ